MVALLSDSTRYLVVRGTRWNRWSPRAYRTVSINFHREEWRRWWLLDSAHQAREYSIGFFLSAILLANLSRFLASFLRHPRFIQLIRNTIRKLRKLRSSVLINSRQEFLPESKPAQNSLAAAWLPAITSSTCHTEPVLFSSTTWPRTMLFYPLGLLLHSGQVSTTREARA